MVDCSKKKKRKKVVQEQVAETPAALDADEPPAQPATNATATATETETETEPTIQAGAYAMQLRAARLLSGIVLRPLTFTRSNSA